ncbi:hypothetical protein JOM56_013825 [Amanita muscaria]
MQRVARPSAIKQGCLLFSVRPFIGINFNQSERSSRISEMTVDSTANLVGREESPEYDWSDYYWTAQPQSPSKDQKGMFYGWKKVVLGSWLNLLLVLLPVAWVLSATMKSSHDLVFAFCTLALIPLVKLHDLSTRDLALRVGGSKTGLINATLSNM